MAEAVSLCLAGLGGVFAGMALLYLSIAITARVSQRLSAEGATATGEKDG